MPIDRKSQTILPARIQLDGLYVGDICTRPSAIVRIVEQCALGWLSGKVASFNPAGETFVDDVHRGALGPIRVTVASKISRMREEYI